jgi:hypothetical protein
MFCENVADSISLPYICLIDRKNLENRTKFLRVCTCKPLDYKAHTQKSRDRSSSTLCADIHRESSSRPLPTTPSLTRGWSVEGGLRWEVTSIQCATYHPQSPLSASLEASGRRPAAVALQYLSGLTRRHPLFWHSRLQQCSSMSFCTLLAGASGSSRRVKAEITMTSSSGLPLSLKGVCHEILRVLFWHVWVDLHCMSV